MLKKLQKKWVQQGRDEMLRTCIEKFEELYDNYYEQGAYLQADLTVDMVAYLQSDEFGFDNDAK